MFLFGDTGLRWLLLLSVNQEANRPASGRRNRQTDVGRFLPRNGFSRRYQSRNWIWPGYVDEVRSRAERGKHSSRERGRKGMVRPCLLRRLVVRQAASAYARRFSVMCAATLTPLDVCCVKKAELEHPEWNDSEALQDEDAHHYRGSWGLATSTTSGARSRLWLASAISS